MPKDTFETLQTFEKRFSGLIWSNLNFLALAQRAMFGRNPITHYCDPHSEAWWWYHRVIDDAFHQQGRGNLIWRRLSVFLFLPQKPKYQMCKADRYPRRQTRFFQADQTCTVKAKRDPKLENKESHSPWIPARNDRNRSRNGRVNVPVILVS